VQYDPYEEIHGLDFAPRADVYRTPVGWVVKFDLAGVSPEDVKIETRGSFIRVSGVRRDRFIQRGYRHHSMEISYSRFERTLQLPCVCEGASVTTEYVDGLLIVTVDAEE
jgi:HSP20 family molecular chaperone IbpA